MRVKGSHHAVEAAKIKIEQAVKKRDVKVRQMELQAQITDKAMREANQRIFLDQKQMATNGQVMAQISPHLFEAKIGDTSALLGHHSQLER